MDNLNELLEHEIKNLYSAEKQLIESFPDISKAASHKKLKKQFLKHQGKSEKHFNRIQKICKEMEVNPGSTKCNVMAGLIEECKDFLNRKNTKEVMDAGLLSFTRKIKHYEIAGYDTAYRYAKVLKLKSVRKLLKKNLKDELKAEDKLRQLGKKKVIKKAMAES